MIPPTPCRVHVNFGLMNAPDVPAALERCGVQGLDMEPMTTSFFLGRETMEPRGDAAMPYWRKAQFSGLCRNARTAADFFGLPPNQVVELGTRVTL